jgi:hypothetical protein
VLRVPPLLQLAITFDRGRMRLPVSLLIIGMGFAPFTPTVADTLGVFRIRGDSATMIFGAPLSLALRLPADALL